MHCLGTAVALIVVTLASYGCQRPADPPAYPSASSEAGDAAAARAATRSDTYYGARMRPWTDPSPDPSARLGIGTSELAWVSTVQDARVALMVSPATGFDSWGIETAIAEIPSGWHTGRHRHGEEAIHVVAGTGYAVVDGLRYDFAAGTTFGIAHGAVHQLYNTGATTVRYVSATPYPLEQFVGIHRMEQLAEAGPTVTEEQVALSNGGFDAQGRRIRLRWEEAEYRATSTGLLGALRARLSSGVDLLGRNPEGPAQASGSDAHTATWLGHHGGRVDLMGNSGETGFPNRLVIMSGLLIDEPGRRSGRHAHMDAVIYVLQGEGYSIIGDRRVDWSAGSSLHIPGPQTEHQHFNTGSEPCYLLRIASGLRPKLEEAVEHSFPYLWFEGRGGVDAD